MSLFAIAWKSIRQRALASSLTGLSVALGVALMVTVLVLNGVVTRLFSQSATGFDLVIGPAKGSPMQLVLNTIYFVDQPIDNLPFKEYLKFKKHPSIAHAIPFALGDTTQDARFRIVGTIPEYFALEYVPGHKFEVEPGGRFLSEPLDAVIGARVARAQGWSVGSQFPIAHGGNVNDVHDQKFTVRGVLRPTGTPSDRAVFIHLDGFYEIPGHEKPLEEALARERAFAGDIANHQPPAADHPQHLPQAETRDAGAPHRIPDEQKEVTAILVQTKTRTLAILLQANVNERPFAQAVNPIEQIGKLLRNVVGNIRTMLVVMTVLIIIVSLVGILVSIYNSMADRRREIAVMRALGASRTTVLSIIVAEAVLLCAVGGSLGLLLGHGMVFVAAPIVEARSDLLIDPWSFEAAEAVLLPALILLAGLVGLVPGFTAYRADVARSLTE